MLRYECDGKWLLKERAATRSDAPQHQAYNVVVETVKCMKIIAHVAHGQSMQRF